MTTYKERKEKTKVFVLRKGDQLIGVYGNLRKMCESAPFDNFPSYWTLARIPKPEGYPIKTDDYIIDWVKLQ